MRLRCWRIYLSSVLRSGPVPDSPLEVGLWVSLNKGVDGADAAVSLGGVIGGGLMVGGGRRAIRWRGVPPHSGYYTIRLPPEIDYLRQSQQHKCQESRR